MFQPISFNAIRQALEWHGFPVPKLRQLSFQDYDELWITAEYLATWSAEQLRQRYGHDLMFRSSHMRGVFITQLRECFCEDVIIADYALVLDPDEFRVLLYIKLGKDAIAAARFVEEINA